MTFYGQSKVFPDHLIVSPFCQFNVPDWESPTDDDEIPWSAALLILVHYYSPHDILHIHLHPMKFVIIISLDCILYPWPPVIKNQTFLTDSTG